MVGLDVPAPMGPLWILVRPPSRPRDPSPPPPRRALPRRDDRRRHLESPTVAYVSQPLYRRAGRSVPAQVLHRVRLRQLAPRLRHRQVSARIAILANRDLRVHAMHTRSCGPGARSSGRGTAAAWPPLGLVAQRRGHGDEDTTTIVNHLRFVVIFITWKTACHFWHHTPSRRAPGESMGVACAHRA